MTGRAWAGPALLVAALAAVQAWALPGDYLGREHDDAHYVLAALSLARGSYRLGISPGDPPLTFITPGFPLLLLPAALVSGESPGGYRLIAWAFLAACDALCWLWLRRRLPAREAVLATLLFGLNPLVLARAGSVMTEAPALALTLALLVVLDSPAWPAWASGLALAFGWLVRQPTVALLPPVLGAHALRARVEGPRGRGVDGRALALSCLGCLCPLAAVAAAWGLWLRGAGSVLPEVHELGSAYGGGLSVALGAAASNALFYARLWGGMWLPPGPAEGVGGLLGSALWTLCGLGAWRILRRGWEPGMVWLACAAAMHLAWPWQYERYLLPLLPMLLWSLIEGAAGDGALAVARPWERAAGDGGRPGAGPAAPRRATGRGLPRPWLTAMLATALTLQFWWQGRHLLGAGARRDAAPYPETYAWLASTLPAQEAVASLFYSRDSLHARRPFCPLPEAGSPEEVARRLGAWRVRFVMLVGLRPGDLGSSLGARFAPARELPRLRASLESPPFRAVYRNPREETVVYELPPGQPPPGRSLRELR